MKKKLYDLAFRLYNKHRAEYEELLYQYKRVDYKAAEIDGRLKIIDKETLRMKTALKKMSPAEKEELLESLKELL